MARGRAARGVLALATLTVLLSATPAGAAGRGPWWPWLLVGGGAGLVTGGGVSWWDGHNDYEQVARARGDTTGWLTPYSMSQQRAAELEARGDRRIGWGIALVGTGVAAIATGAVLLLVLGPGPDETLGLRPAGSPPAPRRDDDDEVDPSQTRGPRVWPTVRSLEGPTPWVVGLETSF